MAKYTVNYTCGHSDSVNLVGPEKDRAKKIAWMQQADCPVCRAKAEAAKNGAVEEVEMKYSEYKNNHADAKTKPNSYNAKTKTVVVYVPVVEIRPVKTEEATEATHEPETSVEETIATIAAAAQEMHDFVDAKGEDLPEEKCTIAHNYIKYCADRLTERVRKIGHIERTTNRRCWLANTGIEKPGEELYWMADLLRTIERMA